MHSESCQRRNARSVKAGLLALVLFLGPLGPLYAEAQEATLPPAGPPRTHTLSGTVVNATTGEAVRRALVRAAPTNGGREMSVLSDSEGRFEFAGLPESDVNILVHKPGFFADSELHPSSFQPQIVHLDADIPALTLTLLPEAVVIGHLAALKGEPIEDSPVRILREVVVDGYRRWELRGQAATDEDGQFRIGDLVPGRYLLATGPNLPDLHRVRSRAARQEGFATMFYPGVPDMESATPITVSGGQQVQADFALKAEPIFQISGTIFGLTPGAGVGLQFMSRAGEVIGAPFDVDMQTGKFHGSIPGGSYTLQARGSDNTGHLTIADLPLTVRGDVEGITLVLSSATDIPVNIVLRPSATAGETPTAAAVPERGLAVSVVRLISTEARIDSMEFQAERTERGALAFHNLPPGRYSVDVTPTQPWYVRSMTSGSTDLQHEDLAIAAGRRPEPLEIVLQDDGASVRVKIQVDGAPGGGFVVLFPEAASLTHAQTAQLGPGTEYYFTGLPPGDYKLLAFDTLDSLEFRNPDVLAPYLSKAATVTVHSGETATVNVEKVSVGK